MNKVLIMAFPFILISCATTMPGRDLQTGSKNVTATIEKNPSMSNELIQMHQFSFKNETNQWIEFDGANLSSGKDVSILVGDKITSWVEACNLEKSVSDYNTSMVLGAIAVTGAVVAGSSHSQTSSAGAIVAMGSISGLAVRDFQNSKNKIEFQKAFPEKHIFQPFVIPPQKVIQRWIMVENPNRQDFELSLKSKTGDSVTLKIEAPKDYSGTMNN